jgi:hypothetical protein
MMHTVLYAGPRTGQLLGYSFFPWHLIKTETSTQSMKLHPYKENPHLGDEWLALNRILNSPSRCKGSTKTKVQHTDPLDTSYLVLSPSYLIQQGQVYWSVVSLQLEVPWFWHSPINPFQHAHCYHWEPTVNKSASFRPRVEKRLPKHPRRVLRLGA